MKIAFLTTEYPTSARPEGGLGNYIRKVATGLSEKGVNVTVFFASNRDDEWNDGIVKVVQVKSWPDGAFPSGWPLFSRLKTVFRHLMTSKEMARAFARYNSRHQFDLVQVPNFNAPGFWLSIQRDHPPLVTRFSSYSPLWRQMMGRRGRLENVFLDFMEIYQAKHSLGCFAPSETIASIIRGKEHLQVEVLRTPIENISSTVVDQLWWGKQNLQELQYFLYVGRFNSLKGIDILVKAFASILECCPNIHLVCAGPSDLMPDGRSGDVYIEEAFAELSNLHIYSPLPKPRLHSLYRNCLAVLIPSRIDNFPNVCLEAQSFKRPVIALRNSGLEEMIDHGINGLLASSKCPESYTGVILEYLNMSVKQRKDMSEEAYNKFKVAVNEDRIELLIQYYNKLLAS